MRKSNQKFNYFQNFQNFLLIGEKKLETQLTVIIEKFETKSREMHQHVGEIFFFIHPSTRSHSPVFNDVEKNISFLPSLVRFLGWLTKY